MYNLNIEDVVLSIKNTPIKKINGIIYQEYLNFFGNNFVLDLSQKTNFEKLEQQTNLNRLKLPNNDIDIKKIRVFFMHTKITKILEKKFKTDLKFDSADIWIDNKGYKLSPHTDDKQIKLSLQIYLSKNNQGTTLYDNKGKKLYTFPFEYNSGYALLNNKHSYHGVEEIQNNGRTSLYVRFS